MARAIFIHLTLHPSTHPPTRRRGSKCVRLQKLLYVEQSPLPLLVLPFSPAQKVALNTPDCPLNKGATAAVPCIYLPPPHPCPAPLNPMQRQPYHSSSPLDKRDEKKKTTDFSRTQGARDDGTRARNINEASGVLPLRLKLVGCSSFACFEQANPKGRHHSKSAILPPSTTI